MRLASKPTKGRTLDYAAPVYDLLEPLCLLSRQAEYDAAVFSALNPQPADRILDLGCGTGAQTQQVSLVLDPQLGGAITGIDAAGAMITAAREKRGSDRCFFEVMAAEKLDFPDRSFDAVMSSLFFHHIPLDLKRASLSEAYRVLKPGGTLVVADMDRPTTFLGGLVSHASRGLFFQPQIAENIRGVLPELMSEAGFTQPERLQHFFGYITVFRCHKEEAR